MHVFGFGSAVLVEPHEVAVGTGVAGGLEGLAPPVALCLGEVEAPKSLAFFDGCGEQVADAGVDVDVAPDRHWPEGAELGGGTEADRVNHPGRCPRSEDFGGDRV